MRIGIDIRSLQGDDRFRGIGAYESSLLQAMSRIDRENEYLLYAWTDHHPLKELGVSVHSNFRLIPQRRRPIHVTAGRLRNWRQRPTSLQSPMRHGGISFNTFRTCAAE